MLFKGNDNFLQILVCQMKKTNLKSTELTPADVTQLSNCSVIVFSAHITRKCHSSACGQVVLFAFGHSLDAILSCNIK